MHETIKVFENATQLVNWLEKNCRNCKLCLEVKEQKEKEVNFDFTDETGGKYDKNECNEYIELMTSFYEREILTETANNIGYENNQLHEHCKKKQSNLDLYELSLSLF